MFTVRRAEGTEGPRGYLLFYMFILYEVAKGRTHLRPGRTDVLKGLVSNS